MTGLFRRTRSVLLGSLALALLISAPSAYAGSYTVVACDDATTGNGAAASSVGKNNSWETFYSSDSVNLKKVGALGSDCQSSSTDRYIGLGVRDNWEDGTTGGITGGGYWQFDVPTGTTISSVNIDRYIGKNNDLEWVPYVEADGNPITQCTSSSDCSDTESTTGDIGNNSIQIGIECGESLPVCDIGSTRSAAWAIIYGASITLSESDAPSLTVDSDTVADNGYVDESSPSVHFDASDPRGIKEARLELDGSTVASQSYACDYTQLTPCSDVVDQTLSFSTGTVTDGSYEVELVVEDAAGNETRSGVGSLSIDHTAPNAPTYLTTNLSSTVNDFSLSWVNPEGPEITKAYYKICSQTGECGTTQSVTGQGISRIDGIQVPSAGIWTAYVWLEDEFGHADSSKTATSTLTYIALPTVSTTPSSGTTSGSSNGSSSSGGSSTETATSDAGSITASDTAAAAKSSGALKVRISSIKRLKGKRLRISGSCSKRVRGKRVTVTYKPKRGGGKLTKKPVCTKGKWRATLRIGERKGGRATVSYQTSGGERARASRDVKT